MSQVTIYLEPELAEKMRAAAESEGKSQSRWLAELVKSRLRGEWPESVVRLAGAWVEFPEAEAIREVTGEDIARESL